MVPTNVSMTFASVVRRAGVPPIRLHDLRHTHASLLIAEGWDPITVADRLGHSNPGFTLARYSHPPADDKGARAAAKFAALVDG